MEGKSNICAYLCVDIYVQNSVNANIIVRFKKNKKKQKHHLLHKKDELIQ